MIKKKGLSVKNVKIIVKNAIIWHMVIIMDPLNPVVFIILSKNIHTMNLMIFLRKISILIVYNAMIIIL